jgi:hypothetical protein
MEEQLQNFYKELYEEELDSNQEELDSDEEELDKMNEDKLDLDEEIRDFDEDELDSKEKLDKMNEDKLDLDEQIRDLGERVETKAEIEEKEKNLASAYDEDANQNSKKSIKSEESTESEESQESEESTESEESQESEESTESEESQESEESTESEESQESEESTESEESQESEESTESEESQESEESTESEESQESEESTESEESQESEESTESEESQESINLLWMLFQKRELMLFKMISHLRKMENEEPFHTYPIEKLFTPAISGLLKESGVNTMKDLLDLKNMGILTLFFPNKERREFGREFSRLYSYFSNMDKFRKSDYSHPEDSIPFGKNDFLKSWLLNMISRLKKMGNENKFHLYPIEKWFTPGVSRILNKSSIANIKDLLDFDNLEDLILGFSNKEAREFTVEFSRLHSIFFILDKNKKDG